MSSSVNGQHLGDLRMVSSISSILSASSYMPDDLLLHLRYIFQNDYPGQFFRDIHCIGFGKQDLHMESLWCSYISLNVLLIIF